MLRELSITPRGFALVAPLRIARGRRIAGAAAAGGRGRRLAGFLQPHPDLRRRGLPHDGRPPRPRDRYQGVNIKLDKTGGLTEAWRLLRAARVDGFRIMVGCMVCSSLGITPALEIAREAAFIDLDGPLRLQDDYPDGVSLQGGFLLPLMPAFWGG
ncbi:MAG TPA: hypothetical protein VL545_14065 [Rhodanobacter sp.]|nr:hypothetical protein [Rhodanobacter sp.]